MDTRLIERILQHVPSFLATCLLGAVCLFLIPGLPIFYLTGLLVQRLCAATPSEAPAAERATSDALPASPATHPDAAADVVAPAAQLAAFPASTSESNDSEGDGDGWYIDKHDLDFFYHAGEQYAPQLQSGASSFPALAGGAGGGGGAFNLICDKELKGQCKYRAFQHNLPDGTTEFLSWTLWEDMTAQEFTEFILDDDTRPEWDAFLAEARVVEAGRTADGEQAFVWLRSFPFGFLSDRLYSQVRRIFRVPGDPHTLYTCSRVVRHPGCDAYARAVHPHVVRVDDFYSMWRARTLALPDGQGHRCEVILLHRDCLKVPEALARISVRCGMWGFVKAMGSAARQWVGARRARGLDSQTEDPLAFCRRGPHVSTHGLHGLPAMHLVPSAPVELCALSQPSTPERVSEACWAHAGVAGGDTPTDGRRVWWRDDDAQPANVRSGSGDAPKHGRCQRPGDAAWLPRSASTASLKRSLGGGWRSASALDQWWDETGPADDTATASDAASFSALAANGSGGSGGGFAGGVAPAAGPEAAADRLGPREDGLKAAHAGVDEVDAENGAPHRRRRLHKHHTVAERAARLGLVAAAAAAATLLARHKPAS